MNVSVCASPFLAERLQGFFGAAPNTSNTEKLAPVQARHDCDVNVRARGGGGGGGVNAGALIRHCNRVNSAVKFALTPHCKTTMRVNAETLQN